MIHQLFGDVRCVLLSRLYGTSNDPRTLSDSETLQNCSSSDMAYFFFNYADSEREASELVIADL